MKAIFKLIKFCFFIIILALVFHNFTAKWLLSVGLRIATGAPVSVESAHINFLDTDVLFEGIEVDNPKGFPKGTMVKIPKIFVDLEIASLWEHRIHLDQVEVFISEINLAKNAERKINFLQLKTFESKGDSEFTFYDPENKHKPTKEVKFLVEKFILSLDKVTYTDYSSNNPASKVLPIHLQGNVYRDVDSAAGMISVIGFEAMKGIGLNALKSGVESAFKDPKGFFQKIFNG